MPPLLRLLRPLHKWLGLLIGLQILLWFSGGLVMSALPLEQVRGEDRAQSPMPAALVLPSLSPQALVQRQGLSQLHQITLRSLMSRPVYEVHSAAGTRLYDGQDGTLLPPIDEALARRIAAQDYVGSAAIATASLLTRETGTEYREKPLPAWRIQFDDERATTLYIAADTGAITARRNSLWRVFDFFWMLHVMDYQTRDDFNHPLLIGAAALALLMALSGLWLLTLLLWRQRGRKN